MCNIFLQILLNVLCLVEGKYHSYGAQKQVHCLRNEPSDIWRTKLIKQTLTHIYIHKKGSFTNKLNPRQMCALGQRLQCVCELKVSYLKIPDWNILWFTALKINGVETLAH